MFSRLNKMVVLPTLAMKLSKFNGNSLNPYKFVSISCAVRNMEQISDWKDLNIFRTFTAKLRPDLEEENKKFNAVFPDVKREIFTFIEKRTNRKTAEYFDRALEYNVPNGKQFRPMQIIMGYKDLVDKNLQTPDKMYQLYMICWALELVNTVIVIHDDMLDGGVVRRGRPCWHTLKDVGNFAVSDYILIIHSGYFILKNHCKDLPCYPRLFEYIIEGAFSTHMGQTMDFVGLGNVTDYSVEMCRKAQTVITSHFLFYTPMSMLMALTGYNNRESIKHICDELGHYHQSQNDMLDIFDIDGVLQKTVHDIEIGKCSWLAVTCMRRANDAQKQIMIENYGKKDPECSIRVKQLFIDMNMLELYREFAYGKYDSIRALIAAADCEDPIKNVLFKTVDLVFHRSMLKSNETFEIPKN